MYELIFYSMGFGFLSCLLACFYAFCGWKLFYKARKKPWKSLIPVYNFYCLSKIAKLKSWLALVYFACFLLIRAGGIFGFFASVYMLLFYLLLNYSLAKAFHKSIIFTIGLIVFPAFFYPILSLDKSHYRY